MTDSFAQQNVEIVNKACPGFIPKIGLVLGSGSGDLAHEIENTTQISYQDLHGFKKGSVAGHSGILSLGELHGVPVACLQGRPHFYEGNDNIAMQTPIRTLKALGCEILIMTNASASLRPEVTPGNLVLVSDHINFSLPNPLIGPNDDEVGPRFPPMDNAYDADLRATMLAMAQKLNIPLTEGVYLGVSGPSYETPAEIRAFQRLGGEVVGMSTVPDVIVARHCGLQVVTIACVTNMGVGLSDEKLTHENVLKVGKQASVNLIRLLRAFLETMSATA